MRKRFVFLVGLFVGVLIPTVAILCVFSIRHVEHKTPALFVSDAIPAVTFGEGSHAVTTVRMGKDEMVTVFSTDPSVMMHSVPGGFELWVDGDEGVMRLKSVDGALDVTDLRSLDGEGVSQ